MAEQDKTNRDRYWRDAWRDIQRDQDRDSPDRNDEERRRNDQQEDYRRKGIRDLGHQLRIEPPEKWR